MARGADNAHSSQFDSDTMDSILFLDGETSIYNKGNPFDPRNFLVSYVTIFHNKCSFNYYTDAGFKQCIKHQLSSCDVICGFNIKFDIHWFRNLGIVVPAHVKIWDLQLAEFILSGQSLPYDSLDAACGRYGLPRKPDVVKSYWDRGISTEHIPIPILQEYNIHDVESNVALYHFQQALLDDKQKALVLLEGDDLRTLQAAEYAGIKLNADGARELVVEQSNKLSELKQSLSKYLPDGIPSSGDRDGSRSLFNWGSGDHLSAFLYGGDITFDYAISSEAVYQSGAKKGQAYTRNQWQNVVVRFPQRFKPLEGTAVAKSINPETDKPYTDRTVFYQTDAPTLQQLKAKDKESKEILTTLHTLAKEEQIGNMAQSLLKKSAEMHWEDNLIHPNFNQNVVVTGRLSSSAPNMQNQPPEIDRLLISRYV
jgi:hypothetical protein